MKQIIEKKDLIYVTLILLISNLILFTKDFYQNPKIFEAIGFLSSVVSIVLSILAIIYTFFQNFHSNSAIEEINNSSKNLADLSIKINETMKFVQNASENLNTELETKFLGVKKDIDDVTRKAISDSFKDIIKYNDENVSINSNDYRRIIERLIQFNNKFNVKKLLIEIETISSATETTFEKLQELMIELVDDNELTEDFKLMTGMGFFLCFIEILSILNIYSYSITQNGVKLEKGINDIKDLLKK